MMLPKINYIKVNTLTEAYDAINQCLGELSILAGETDLLIELRKKDLDTHQNILDISNINLLKEIKENGELIKIGSLVTHTQLAESPILKKHAALLAQAASMIGSLQIRNRGTIGGNICNASPCADTVPPLVALDAEVTLSSIDGERVLPVADFIKGPYKTARKSDEILTCISFKKLPEGCRSHFIKLGRRNALSIARLQVAVVGMLDNTGNICYIKLAPGSSMPTPTRLHEVEKMLINEKPTSDLFVEAGERTAQIMIEKTGIRWSTEYKKPVLAALVRRGLEKVFKKTTNHGDTETQSR
ncbi:xanthine dehydrogenase family protein subunit M [bacterium]|nr:xanthine dehydrogenase family protein subunit M [bacterium]